MFHLQKKTYTSTVDLGRFETERDARLFLEGYACAMFQTTLVEFTCVKNVSTWTYQPVVETFDVFHLKFVVELKEAN